MVFVLAKVAVQLALVVVQAVGEGFKMTSLAALVVVLAVLAEEPMLAQVALRGVVTVLGLHNKMEWWVLGLCVMAKSGGQCECADASRVGADGWQRAQHQDSHGSDRGNQDQIGGNDERTRGGRRRSDGGRDRGRVGRGGVAVGARGNAGGGRGIQDDELVGARRGSRGARRVLGFENCTAQLQPQYLCEWS